MTFDSNLTYPNHRMKTPVKLSNGSLEITTTSKSQNMLNRAHSPVINYITKIIVPL
jgi:hypothetical protein